MSNPENADELTESLRKMVESDPNDWISRGLLEMAENHRIPKPFKRSKLPEIEDEDPKRAGREGECDLALEVLLELYPSGEPYRLTTNGHDYAHVFLLYHGRPMDIAGIITLEKMKHDCSAEQSTPEPINVQNMRRYFANNRSKDEAVRYREHFKKYILANIGTVFPPPEPREN